MGSLSADKAGVGSAVNDTTRELGGTLGVAIVGSVFASIYSSRLGTTRRRSRRCPKRLAPSWASRWPRRSRSSRKCRRPRRRLSASAVETAFLDGQWIGSLVSAGIALTAAVVVAGLLPARARQTVPTAIEIEQSESEAVCA